MREVYINNFKIASGIGHQRISFLMNLLTPNLGNRLWSTV